MSVSVKHSCLTLTRSSAFAAFANLGYISDIIIIIIFFIIIIISSSSSSSSSINY